MKLVVRAVLNYKKQLLGLVFFTILGLLAELVSTGFISVIINKTMDLIEQPNEEAMLSFLFRSGSILLLLAVLYAAMCLGMNYFSSRIATNVGRDLRKNVFEQVMKYSMDEVDSFSIASLITICTNDITGLQQFVFLLMISFIQTPFLIIGGIICVSSYHAHMEWTVVLASFATVTVFLFIFLKSMPIIRQTQIKLDNLNQISRESLTGVQVIRAFNREKWNTDRLNKASEDIKDISVSSGRIMMFLQPSMNLIMNVTSVIIVLISLNKVSAGLINVGIVANYIAFVQMIVVGVMMLAAIVMQAPRVFVFASRIESVLNMESAIVDGDSDADVNMNDICFDHVSFKYDDNGGYAIKDISFEAQKGKTTAIIGPTGCGKSTIIKLMLRLYGGYEGSIKTGNTEITKLSLSDLRNLFGYVPQNAVLMSGNIKSNILFGANNLSEENMQRAAEISQSLEFIENKENGFESEIARAGSNVSGGQKQRLSIARAIARDAKIYLFDDSFSALDYKTDAALRKQLEEKLTDKTIIIVGQRISSIMDADQILVMNNGQIVGRGTHKELIKNCPFYIEIAKSQMTPDDFKKCQEAAEL